MIRETTHRSTSKIACQLPRFAELGATRMQEVGLGDDQAEDKWETAWVDWSPALFDEMALPPPPQVMLPASTTIRVEAKDTADPAAVSSVPKILMPRDAAGAGVMVPIETMRALTPAGRDLRHYEFNIEGTGLSYEAGDALGIFSTNGKDRVDDFLHWYGLKSDDIISVEKPSGVSNAIGGGAQHFTAGQLFSQHLDIFGRPKRQFIEMLALMAEDPAEKEELFNLLTKEGKDHFRELTDDTNTTADYLRMYPSAKVPVEYLLDFVPAIKPRLYSIASASEMHPNHIHTCIVEEDWEKKDGEVLLSRGLENFVCVR